MDRIFRAKRAIIMAAGKGERLRPLALSTPKSLVSVNGVRMIESAIGALRLNGIFEIYIVVGYLRGQFAYLEEAYPGVRLIYNPDFETWNNLSSLYRARELLGDCIIMDGDQIIRDPDVLEPTFLRSGYNAVWTDKPTDEWLLRVDDGIIRSCSRTGGQKGWQLYSVSRWSSEDGKKLKGHLEKEYRKGNRSVYWDDIALFLYPDEYSLGIREMKDGDVLEIDTFEELCRIDPSYA